MHELERKKNKSWYNNWHKEMIFAMYTFFPFIHVKIHVPKYQEYWLLIKRHNGNYRPK